MLQLSILFTIFFFFFFIIIVFLANCDVKLSQIDLCERVSLTLSFFYKFWSEKLMYCFIESYAGLEIQYADPSSTHAT